MTKALITYIILCISHLAVAQDKVIYDANAEKRTVGSFQAVQVSHGIDLYISQSNEEGLVVSATQVEHRNKIKTEVENGVLKIWFDSKDNIMGWNWRGRNLKAYISVKTIREIRASGGSDVKVQGALNTSDLTMKLSGGSDFNGQLNVTNLTIDQSGGSDSHVKGKAVNVKVEASGGSDFNGYDLTAEYAILKASGGSDAEITVTKELAAEASGGSDVNYKGSPVIKYKSSSGGSSVTNRG